MTEWQEFLKNQMRLGGRDLPAPKLVSIDRLNARWQSDQEPRWTRDRSPDTGKIEGRLGNSDVVVLLPSLCQLPSGLNGVDGLIERIEAAAPRAACEDKNALEMVVRACGDTRYVCVLNPSVDDPAESMVHVQGAFRSLTDLDYPDGFPVPATIDDGVTSFGLKLAPGEGTILRLSP